MPKLTVPIIDTLGRDAITSRLGVTVHSVRFARTAGSFPASWYAPLLAMCAEAGIDCPLEAFNWKSPAPPVPDAAPPTTFESVDDGGAF